MLLSGVNDDAETLEALMRALVECRVKPYYLHHARSRARHGHLRTSIAKGQALMRALHGRVSGLCQPTYVLDIPGGHGKVPVGPRYIDMCGEAGAVRRRYQRQEAGVFFVARMERSVMREIPDFTRFIRATRTNLRHRLRRLRRHARRALLHQLLHRADVHLAGAEDGDGGTWKNLARQGEFVDAVILRPALEVGAVGLG